MPVYRKALFRDRNRTIKQTLLTGENDSDEILTDHRFSMSRAHSPCCESERNHSCLLRRLSARYQNRCAEPERYRVSHFKREPNGT